MSRRYRPKFLDGLLLAGLAACVAQPIVANGQAKVSLDTSAAADGVYPPEVFGLNWNWLEGGGGLLEFGDLLKDRSFRNQADPKKRSWIESPNKEVRGTIEHVAKGGDERPWGGRGFPGYVKLSQRGQGYTCVSQRVVELTVPGAQYELHVSARSEGGKPALSVFFADTSLMPIEPLDKLSWVESSTWTAYKFTLKPEKQVAGPYLRVCIVSAGEAGIDELRLRRLGGNPRIKEPANARIRELGVRSLRWPTGSDADHFDWRESIGPLRERGENPSEFGVWETPSLGLHEFLDYCEAARIIPLITVNVLLPPDSAAALVEYVLGSEATPMGALRAKSGRKAPWDVKHFELGNEPTERYRAGFDQKETAKGYVTLATGVATAMKARAEKLGRPIELKGIVETTFAIADWIKAVPMLANWNRTVLDPGSGVRQKSDQIKGHFYSAFTWSSSERDLYEEVMGGGATIAATVQKLNKDYGKLPAFWLTEYAVMVQRSRTGGPEILLERAKDYQAGLAAADVLIAAMQERFGGAYLFNLAQWGTWGVIGNAVDFRLRPSGLAFSLLSPFAGETRVPVRVAGGKSVRLSSGKGNNPANMQYPTLSAVASRSGSTIQVVILNRSYDADERVAVDLGVAVVKSAEIQQLGPEKTAASNEEQPDAIRIRKRTATGADAQLVAAPARSLTRIVYSLK